MYGGGEVVENCGYGRLCEAIPEAALIDELLVQGCWVEASGVISHHVNQQQYMSHQKNSQKKWWIGPIPSSSVKERLLVAVAYLRHYYYTNISNIQIWVPPTPTNLHPHYAYSAAADDHDHEENTEDVTSIFLPKLLQQYYWTTPVNNVRFFRTHHCYPHSINYKDDGGAASLPVFQRGSGACLGVLQILMDHQSNNINYPPQPQLLPPCNHVRCLYAIILSDPPFLLFLSLINVEVDTN